MLQLVCGLLLLAAVPILATFNLLRGMEQDGSLNVGQLRIRHAETLSSRALACLALFGKLAINMVRSPQNMTILRVPMERSLMEEGELTRLAAAPREEVWFPDAGEALEFDGARGVWWRRHARALSQVVRRTTLSTIRALRS